MTHFTETVMDRLADLGQSFKDRVRRNDDGAISAEYVAILLVVAGIVAAVMALNISGAVSDCGENAKTAMFNDAADTAPESIANGCAGE